MPKKIYSLLLVFMMLFTPVSYVSAAETADTQDYAHMMAKGTLNAIGVSFDSRQPVTRGEFVKALVQATGMSGVAGNTIPYVDVTEASLCYEAIKTAYELSWISEASVFYPDSQITLAQALKMGVHAIGGEHQAAYWGGYPAGYLRLAQNTELLEDISSDNDSALSVRDAYVLIYNILISPTFETGFGDDGSLIVSYGGKSILENYYDMYIYEGIVTATKVTNLYDESDTQRDKIKVGNQEFYDEKNLHEYLGYNVYVLCRRYEGKVYAEFVCPFDTNVITLDNYDIEDVDGNIITYGEFGDEKLHLSQNFSYVLNGKTVLVTTNDYFELFNKRSSEFTFIDNNNDKRYDVVCAYEYTYAVVNKYDLYDGMIYDMNTHESLIDLSADECQYTVRVLEDGVYSPAKLSDIEAGMVVAYAASADKTYVDIILCRDSVRSKAAELSSDGSVFIEGEHYYLSDYYKKYYTFKIGEQINFCIGINGEIVAEANAQSSMKYAFIIDSTKKTGLSEEISIKLFDQSNEVLVLGVADKVILDGERKTASDIYAFAQARSTNSERFVRYSVNSEDKIICIDSYEDKIGDIESIGDDTYDDNHLALRFDGNFLPRGSKIFQDSSGVARFNWSGTEYIFIVPDETERDDEELYRIADASEIKSGSNTYKLDLLAFDTNLAGSPKALVVYGGYLQNKKSIAAYGVVERIVDAINEDGDKGYKIYVADNTGHKSLFLSQQVATKYLVPSEGDIIGYSYRNENDVNYIVKSFDFKTYTISSSYSSESESSAFASGFVYSLSGGYMHYLPAYMSTAYIPQFPKVIEADDMRNTNYAHSSTVYIDAVRSADGTVVKSVTVSASPDIKLRDARTSGAENATFVVNWLAYNKCQVTYAYNIIYK